MNVMQMAKDLKIIVKKHSPEILTGIGVAGMIATTVMAVKATPKAILLINEKEVELGEEKLAPADIVKTTWKCYIPATVTGVMSIACIVGASSVNARRNAALVTAYTISETALKEYKEKVVEMVGEKKEKTVRDAIAKDKIDKNPVSQNEIILTHKGDTLCYDVMSGRYFKSDMEALKRVENELNRRMLEDGSVSLNDLYDLIGGDMDPILIGDDLGWDTRQGLINLSFSSQLASDGTPCLVLDFSVAPKYDYYK